MLADVADDNRSPTRQPPQIVDDMRGVEVAIVRQILNIADGRVTFRLLMPSSPGTSSPSGVEAQPATALTRI